MLKGKHIILGISGGIAAYKSAILIRLLNKSGAEVKVVASQNALEFITKVTIETLSQNKLFCDLFSNDNDYTTEHVSLSDWGEIFIMAPATTNIIGKLACGIADDALSSSLLAFKGKLFLAPSMNVNMYEHLSVQKNLQTLREIGVHIIEPGEGYLACGYEGKGRMEEPENIIKIITDYLAKQGRLAGKKALVTAGPTHEAIDAVRYIGNHSTGLMGIAIAEALAENGADITLVCGPSELATRYTGIHRINVCSADEMYNACLAEFPKANITVMAAAVADYTYTSPTQGKIKKTGDELLLKLTPTKDILLELGRKKRKGQLLIGFALETDDALENAREKLNNKNLDFIVINSLEDAGAGFAHTTNKISILDKSNKLTAFELKEKKEAAKDIVAKIFELIH